jgi:hypothetical protein
MVFRCVGTALVTSRPLVQDKGHPNMPMAAHAKRWTYSSSHLVGSRPMSRSLYSRSPVTHCTGRWWVPASVCTGVKTMLLPTGVRILNCPPAESLYRLCHRGPSSATQVLRNAYNQLSGTRKRRRSGSHALPAPESGTENYLSKCDAILTGASTYLRRVATCMPCTNTGAATCMQCINTQVNGTRKTPTQPPETLSRHYPNSAVV